jgi:hypothetical protein
MEPSAIIETRSLSFNTASLQWELTIIGFGFEGSPELYIGGFAQELVYICETKMIFAIINSPSETLTGMHMYFDDGYPDNHTAITTDRDDLVMTPELVSISPNEGSIAGTRLEVAAPGVTVSTTIDVVDASGTSICE